jgi:uncharacterized membrane protein HdeD (DUF308 family)
MTSPEEISERKEKDTWFIPIIGIIVILIGYVVYDFHINTYLTTQTGRQVLLRAEYPYQLLGLLLMIVGIVIISIGIGKKLHSGV